MFNAKSFSSILQLLAEFPDEQSCILYLEKLRWNGNVISPFDETSKVYKCKNNRYKCSKTNKYFNVLTNTVFENTKIELKKWFVAIYLFTSNKKGISSYQLEASLDITQKSAWFLLSRIRYATEHSSFMRELEGTIEVDETFVGGKNKNRHGDKKVKNSQGRSFKDKTPVMGMIERGGGLLKCKVVKDTKADSIQPIVLENVKLGSNLMSDEWWAYRGMNQYYNHSITDHSKGQYVNGEASTNCMENFWSNFKRTLNGAYNNRVSRKHLQLYVDESVFRFNTRKSGIQQRFDMLLETSSNRRLKYKDLIN